MKKYLPIIRHIRAGSLLLQTLPVEELGRFRHLYAALTDGEKAAASLTPPGMEVAASVLLGVSLNTIRRLQRTPQRTPLSQTNVEGFLRRLVTPPVGYALDFALGCPPGYEKAMARALQTGVVTPRTHTSPASLSFLQSTVWGNATSWKPA
jgi:hypothetical protein